MISNAICRYIRISPYKLRPIADVVRGKKFVDAMNWLLVNQNKRTRPFLKTIASAYANAKNLNGEKALVASFVVSKIIVDGGPTVSYSKPSAMGKASLQTKRTSHLSVSLVAV